ncbi:MAG: polysialyltransferase family glycosyltransferase [Myxococcota bacterium]
MKRIRRIPPWFACWLPVARSVGRFSANPPIVLATPHRPHVPATSLCLRLALQSRRPLELAFLDEGLGSYRDTAHWVRSTREGDRRSPISAIQIPRLLTKSLLRTHSAPVRRNLLQEHGVELRPDPDVAAGYASYFLGRASRFASSSINTEGRPPMGAIIWLSQPITASSSEWVHCVKWLREVGVTLRARGVPFWVKLHPRESGDTYTATGLPIVQESGSIEELMPIFKPAAVVGRTSTGLVTAAALYGIPAFSVNHLPPFRDFSANDDVQTLFARLKRLVESPASMQELLERFNELIAARRESGALGVTAGWRMPGHDE